MNYNKKDKLSIDPNVDNGMMTKIWGPPGWLFLHSVTFGYPYIIDNKKLEHVIRREQTKSFFHNIGYVLPCKYCRESYIKFMKELPVEDFLNSRKDLTLWLYKMHNKVNYKLGVPECDIPSFKDIQVRYETYRAKCSKTTEAERVNNIAKGCVTPADGTTKRCYLKVIKTKKGDITRRNNKQVWKEEDIHSKYLLINKYHVLIIGIIILFLFLFYIYKKKGFKFFI